MAISTYRWREELADLLTGYEKGLYTRLEVPSKVIDLIDADNFSKLWHTLPGWVQDDILENVPFFTEAREVIPLGGGKAEAVKRQLLLVKQLLIEYGAVDRLKATEPQ